MDVPDTLDDPGIAESCSVPLPCSMPAASVGPPSRPSTARGAASFSFRHDCILTHHSPHPFPTFPLRLSPPSMDLVVTVHYRRHLGDYEDWSLWTWAAGGDDGGGCRGDSISGGDGGGNSSGCGSRPPAAVRPTMVPGSRGCLATDSWGAVFRVPPPPAGASLGFRPRFGAWAAVDGGDRVVGAAAASAGAHLYVLQGAPAAYGEVADFLAADGTPRFLRVCVSGGEVGAGGESLVADAADAAGVTAMPVHRLVVTAETTNYVVDAFMRPAADGGGAAVLGEVLIDRAAFPPDVNRLGLALAPVSSAGAGGRSTFQPSCWWSIADGAVVELQVAADGGLALRGRSCAGPSLVKRPPQPPLAMATASSSADGGDGLVNGVAAAAGSGFGRAPPLVVRYQRYASDYDGWTLTAVAANRGELPVRRTSRLYHGMVTFEVAVPAGWPASVEVSLRLRPPPSSARATAGAKVDVAAAPSTCADQDTVAVRLWTPALGRDVVVAQDLPDVRPLHAATRELFYHRMEALESDWRQWRLRLWTTVRGPSTATKAASRDGDEDLLPPTSPVVDRRHELLPRELVAPGVVAYELTPLLFHDGDTVHVQPVKVEPLVSQPIGGDCGDVPDMTAAVQEVSADVARQWTILPGVVPARHVVQGQWTVFRNIADVQAASGDTAVVDSASRYFFIRYRRFGGGASEYAGWALWACDVDAPNGRGLLIESASVDPVEGALFLVDRGRFGGGARLRLVPRHTGKGEDDTGATVEWDATTADAALRVSTADVTTLVATTRDSDSGGAEATTRPPPALTLVQGHSSLLRSLAAERSPVMVSVDSPWDVSVTTFCPLEWLSGTRPVQPWDAVVSPSIRPKVTLYYCGDDGVDVELPWVTWERPSPTEVVLRLSEAVADGQGFHEDFPVELVEARAAGFPPSRLAWRSHADVDAYFYPGTMGCICAADATLFRVFAPTADAVAVVLYEEPTGDAGRRELPMRRIPQGCWKAIVPSCLGGTYYKLLATGADALLFPGVEVIDPYSRCNTHHTGRGLILGPDDPAVAATVAPRPPVTPADATVIWELHLRDATVDPAGGVVGHRGKYLGLTQPHTVLAAAAPFAADSQGMVDVSSAADALANPTVDANGDAPVSPPLTTALAHLVEMGATAVQLLPLQDFDNNEDEASGQYAWGYMPVHFFSPDGWYASGSRTDSSRVVELKALVSALHAAGLRVILDVVFNHTAEDVNERNLDARFSFNGLAPRYYYRTCGNTPMSASGHRTCAMTPVGTPTCGACYSNGSGCGNEVRSEAPMARKFILDCLRYWATEFGMDGFRFDLMGLVDVPTLTAASAALKAIDSGIVVYGEPWTGGITPVAPTYKGTQRGRGFGVFNDTFRDALRGSPFHAGGCFVLDGVAVDDVKRGIMGSIDDFADEPTEVINYVECHDNRTLYDQLWEIYRGGGGSDMDPVPPEEELASVVAADKAVAPAPDTAGLAPEAAAAVATAAADAAALATSAAATAAAGSVPALLRRCALLATAILLTAQGVPFLQLGQEFFRTKGGDHNSYISPDAVNAVRWARKAHYATAARYVAGLVALRRAHPEVFALPTAALVRERLLFFETMGVAVPDGCIAYRVDGCSADVLERATAAADTDAEEEAARWTAVLVLINPLRSPVTFALPEAAADQLWVPVVAGRRAGTAPVGDPVRRSTAVASTSLTVLRRCSATEAAAATVADRLASVADAGVVPTDGDPTSRYAVGLDAARGPAEAAAMVANVRARRMFLGLARTGKTRAQPPALPPRR